jgi:uroporphyrinogen decarboxylase
MDFGGTQFSCAEPKVLAGIRDILGLPLAADRDADGVWPDESIMRAFGVDLRWVPYVPPLAVMQDLYPSAYQKEMELLAKGPKLSPEDEIMMNEPPLLHATLDDILKMKPQEVAPSPYIEWRRQVATTARQAGYAVSMSVCAGFFERGCWTRGYEQIAIDLLTEPDMVRALFDLWMQENIQNIENMIKPMAGYVDILCFGDDLGMQNSTFMSLNTYREMVKPYMAELYRLVRQAAPQAFIFHHSCGAVYPLLDDLIEVGIQILNPIQPNAKDMTPEKLKDKGRGRLCFHGGMDLQELLPRGTPAQIREEKQRRMALLGDGGGYIYAPAHIVPEDVPAENIVAMYL